MHEQPDAATGLSREKRYNRLKLRMSIADIILNVAGLCVLAFTGISPLILSSIRRYATGDYPAFMIFVAVVGIAYSIVGFPLDFYSGYVIEHRFNLSNQSLSLWLTERAKSAAVGLAIGVPVALAFYFFLKAAGWFWWLYFSVFMFLVSVLMARVAPVVIFPLFYKFSELESGEIKDRIAKLLSDQGISFRGIYSFNMSKDTKKANAGFAGIGRSKRIIISDTLIQHFSPGEIGVVFAHEMGHYKKRHIVKSIVYGASVIFLSFFLCGELYRHTLIAMGYEHAYDIAAIPVLLLYLTLFSLIIMPVSNALSRMHEREADRFALEVTGDRGAFVSSMERLADLNLADRDPNPVVEFMFYSHPSIRKRIRAAEEYRP